MLLSGIHGASRALAGCPIKAFGHDDCWYTGNIVKLTYRVTGRARWLTCLGLLPFNSRDDEPEAAHLNVRPVNIKPPGEPL
jgi:hypothetical protein